MNWRTPPRTWRFVRPLPVLWRGTGELQIGLDPDESVILSGVPDELPALLAALDGAHTRADLAAAAPGLEQEWIDWTLARLSERGLIDDLPTSKPRIRCTLLAAPGALADLLTDALLSGGIDSIDWVELGPKQEQRADPDPDRDLDLRVRLTTAVPAAAGFTVVADGRMEPDRVLTDDLTRRRLAHLIVRIDASSASVGPLVVPGRTPCVRCTDHARRRDDPAWPTVLAQLSRLPHPGPELALRWAAVTAAQQSVAYLRGHQPDSLGSSLELSARDGLVRHRAWPAQPACGCLWSTDVAC